MTSASRQATEAFSSDTSPARAQDWVRILANYRNPSIKRSIMELVVSLGPFIALWALALWALTFSGWLALGIALFNGGFLLRIFVIQHDCGHGSYFNNRHANDWVGRVLGVLTLTPYDVWRRTHSIHHSASGNLEKRGMGDVMTLTVTEYKALSKYGKFKYRFYRNPFVLFVLGPTYLFVLQNRLPIGLMNAGHKYWTSAMATNAALVAIIVLLGYFGSLWSIFLIFVPTVLMAASAGVWLFYVQHQFEETNWDHDTDWQLHESALHGSSHYVLPAVLQWFSANIGIHHVHHLYSRIPFYRLTEVLRDNRELATAQRLTIRESMSCVRFHLWDENSRKLMTFAEARKLTTA